MKFMPIIFAIATIKTSALAAPTADAGTPEQLYAEGQAAYDRADYPTAIAKWQASYDLSNASGLLFNLAQAYRLSGDCRDALLSYEHFIALDPTSDQRSLAEDFARELEAQCGATTQQPQLPTVVEAQPQPHSGRELKLAGLVTGGSGIVLIATGIGLGRHAQTIASEVTSACAASCDWSAEETRDASGRRYAAIGQALDAIGATAIVGGAILYYFGDREGRDDGIRVAPMDRSRGAILSWSGSW